MQPGTNEYRRKEQWSPPYFAAIQFPGIITVDIFTAMLVFYSIVEVFEVSPLLTEQTQASCTTALKHNPEMWEDASVQDNNNSKFLVNLLKTVEVIFIWFGYVSCGGE